MSISIAKKDERNIDIILGERFDFSCVEEFRRAYESITGAGNKQVNLNFRNTKYMDSSALGMLINARAFLLESSAKVVIVNCNDQIKKIFSISRFDRKFEIN